MFELKGKAGAVAGLISKMTARESGGSALFSPLIAEVNIKKKSIAWSWITSDHTAFTWGKAEKLKLTGKSGQYVIDAELVDWVNKLFGDDEEITIQHRGTTVHLKGDKYEAQLTPSDADAARIEDASQLKVKDNLPVLGEMEWSEVKIKASEINAILSPTTLVYGQKEIKVVRLTFNKKGSLALIGSMEAHATGIARPLDAKVKKGFEIILGSNFAEVMSVLSGSISLYGQDIEHPIWILKEGDNLTVGYLVAQYDEVQAEREREEEEAEEEDDDESESEEGSEEAEEVEEESEEDDDDDDLELGED